MKQHFGLIRVQSKVGEGTTFEILLPVDETEKVAPAREVTAEPVRGRHENILLVDDEPALRTMMCMALKHFGYTVLEASSGQQALDLFEQAAPPIDLLLTDMVMPNGMSGRDLAGAMCRQRPELRVLYTSGYHLDLVSRDRVSEGVSFLQKPFSMQKLAGAVQECLRRRQ